MNTNLTLRFATTAAFLVGAIAFPAFADDADDAESAAESRVQAAEKRMERKLATAEADVELYEQMVRIAAWISQYCIWNRHWPDPGDQENDAVRQLNELCPNNPFEGGKIQQTEGFSTDPIYQYYSAPTNIVTGASSGFEGDSPEPTTTFGALGDKRIRMAFDPSLTAVQAKEWSDDPPDEWEAPPGTITSIANGTDLVVIWGSGADGKPIRVPGTKRARIFVTSVKMNATERSNY
ncbi:MAG: hypothetical protein K2X93_14905 [Candidatus Obscuribacterales bacterium]|nr:hypothetical protein [Candidatus Obscuribacterales bacterium]